MLKYRIRQLPLLDENKRLLDIYFLDDIITYEKKDNYVFILEGGLGTRLRPLTEVVPKPMLKVGDKPILELIIEQFREYGFKNFIISVNFLGNVIEDYFGDGKNFDVNIEYIREDKRLGTAGSIRLAEDRLINPFIVINGDILTGIDFDSFLRYHVENEFNVTAGVRSYEFTVPYGVINARELVITSLEEKPTFSYYINSGVYALNPEMIRLIPPDQIYNMTDLINDGMIKDHRAGIYQITEYWADIGQLDDYKKANEDVKKFF
jgi:NDP-sugar pyrophosphorylase family protein